MRRKLFFIALILFLLLSIFDFFRYEVKFKVSNEKGIYYGKVTNIKEHTEDKTRLVISMTDGTKVLATIYKCRYNPQYLWKANVNFHGTLEEPQGQRNPGCFDYAKYLRSEGISAVITVKNFNIEHSQEDNIENVLIQKRFNFIESMPLSYKGIVSGILFGEKEYLDDDIYRQFRENGTAHILAVSGLHVGVIYNLINKCMTDKKSKVSLFLSTFLLITYCLLSMWSFSAMRATAMILLKEWGTYFDRRYDMLSAASAVAIAFMVSNPNIVYNAGFQMSFLAVISISFFQRLLPKVIPDGVSVMLAVNLGLLPYQIYQFNILSIASVIANIPVVYLAGILMPFSLLQFIIFSLYGKSFGVEIFTDAISNFMVGVNDSLSLGTLGHFDMVSMPLWVFIFIYLSIFYFASENFEILRMRNRYKMIVIIEVLILIIAALTAVMNYSPLSDADVLFLDVGQGDCVHIEASGKNVLIDGGGSADYNVGEKILKPYLLKNGVKKVDLAIATHLHTDHYKGLKELMDEGKINKIFSEQITGNQFVINDKIMIKTLWPLQINNEDSQDENENCSVFMIYYNNHKILITGDLDSLGERKMVEYYKGTSVLKADILKIGHHGSKYSTCDTFLEAVNPTFAVIQVGKNNYGHPDSKVIEKCKEKGIIVLRNDTHGCVGFSLSGDNITYGVQSEQN